MGHLPGCPEKPRRHVAAQDKVWATRFTDAAGGDVVAAACTGPAGGPVQGFHQLLCQMALRPDDAQPVDFFSG